LQSIAEYFNFIPYFHFRFVDRLLDTRWWRFRFRCDAKRIKMANVRSNFFHRVLLDNFGENF